MVQDDEAASIIEEMVTEHVGSPSVRHIRDREMVHRLAKRIARRLGRSRDVWRKWDEPREKLLRDAARCWIPIGDLRDYLNEMEGPILTDTDVEQRLRAIHDEPYEQYPNEHVREGCLTLYEREKALGTELPAIVGALQMFHRGELAGFRLGKLIRIRPIEVERFECQPPENDNNPTKSSITEANSALPSEQDRIEGGFRLARMMKG